MSNQKKLNVYINKMVDASFKDSKLQVNILNQYKKIIDHLPKLQRMVILKGYISGLKKHIEDRNLRVESSVELNKEELNEVTKTFAKKFEIIDSKSLINKDLLGGIRIKVADFIFDDSIKARIENLKGALSA